MNWYLASEMKHEHSLQKHLLSKSSVPQQTLFKCALPTILQVILSNLAHYLKEAFAVRLSFVTVMWIVGVWALTICIACAFCALFYRIRTKCRVDKKMPWPCSVLRNCGFLVCVIMRWWFDHRRFGLQKHLLNQISTLINPIAKSEGVF